MHDVSDVRRAYSKQVMSSCIRRLLVYYTMMSVTEICDNL